MTFRPIKALLEARPVTLIAAVVLIKALVFFALIPLIQQNLSTFYGISFADNYQLLGENLAEGNGYRFSFETAPTLMREAGYPLFLSVLFSVFGFSLNAARFFNLIFSFVSAVLVSRMAGQVTGNDAARRIAPLLLLIHPGVVIAELRGGVEGLFIMLLLCFFTALYTALASRRIRDYFIAGLVLGVASTVRSTALLFPSFLVFYFFLWERARPTLFVMASRIAVVVAGSVLVLSPWIIRNYELVQKFAPTASVAGVSAHAGYYICTNLKFSNRLEDVDYAAATARSEIARAQGYRFREAGGLYYLYFYDPQDEIRFNSFLGGEVFGKYRESPELLLTCAAKNAFNFWFAGKSWTSTAANVAVQLPYLVLAAFGLFQALRGGFKSELSNRSALLLLFIVYTLGVYLPILSQARYSIHLIPMLSILAALALANWWQKSQRPAPHG